MTVAFDAANAFLSIAKKTQNGSLTADDLAAVPEGWRWWLAPRTWGQTPREPKDGPLESAPIFFACFVDRLEAAVRHAIRLEGRVLHDDDPIPAELLSLIEISCVWYATWRGSGRLGAQSGAQRRLTREMLARALADRPRSYPPPATLHAPTVRSLDVIVGSFDDEVAADMTDTVGAAPDLPDLFSLILDAAVDRFPPAPGALPVARFYRQQIATGAIAELGLCAGSRDGNCSSADASCSCWASFCRRHDVPVDLPNRGGAVRSYIHQGQVAVDLAAWRLTRGTLIPPLAVAAAATTPGHFVDVDPGLAAIGHLISLHASRFSATGRFTKEDERLLLSAAVALDGIEDLGALRVGADIAAATITMLTPHLGELGTPLAEETAHLARTASGAYRELRLPIPAMSMQAAVALSLDTRPSRARLRLSEAQQDRQLGLQRIGAWKLAREAYAASIAEINALTAELGTSDEHALLHRKATEVREQLALGRFGGLLQEAELAISESNYERAEILLGEASRISEVTFGVVALLEDPTDAPGDNGVGFLRFTPRWRVMPTIMRSRLRCDQAAVAVHRGDDRTQRQEAIRRARAAIDDVNALARTVGLLSRQEWELARVRVALAVIDDDADFGAAVQALVEFGGDDSSGDYILPLLRHAAEQQREGSAWRAEIDEARRAIKEAPRPGFRLPDARAVVAC